MSNLSLGEIFYKLERTLRFAGAGGWLPLEPVNPELLSELKEVISLERTEEPPKIPEDISTETKLKGVISPERTEEPPKTPKDISAETERTTEIYVDPEPPAPETAPLFSQRPEDANSLHSLRLRLRDCPRCPLCLERKTVVFGQGNTNADIMFIGEAPGSDEDKSGLAFVGKAGQLLTQIIQSIGLNREDVYICNAIKCRPPGNRNPSVKEINKCSPFLFKQIDILKPRLIVVLGAVALKTLLPQSPGITKARGKLSRYKDIPVFPTFHPSYLLRYENALPLVWNDMRQIRQIFYRLSSAQKT